LAFGLPAGGEQTRKLGFVSEDEYAGASQKLAP